MKTKMMKISVILSFLLCWSFASSNPHREKLNDKSASGLNNINDASDTLNLATKELSDEASSGKDSGGNVLNFLTFFNRKDLTDENDQADNKSFLNILISQGSKFIDNLISKNDLSDIPLFGNIITWVQENIEALGKLFKDDKKEKLNDRVKRDLGTSGLLWAKPHKGGISEHLLKLSEGSTSNVLKSEKATVAEALNGRAIRKILERAKAKTAKAAQHKNLFDNDDFSKWFLSESTFDTDIFNHPFYRPSYNVKLTKYSEAEDTDSSDRNTFSVLHHASEPTNRQETKHAFNMLSDPAAVDTTVTERSHTKLLHKPEHQKHLSSKLQITLGEEHGHETNGMFHKPAVSPHTHGSLSHEDEEHTEHASSHAHVPHMHFRVTEDEGTNDVPKWKHIKWTYADSPRERAPHISRFTESNEFDTSDEMERYNNRFIFKTLFEPREEGEDKTNDEIFEIEYPEKYKYSDEIYFEDMNEEDLLAALNSYVRYYGIRDREYYQNFDNTKNRHLAGKPSFEQDSPINLYGEENIDGDKYSLDGVQRSAIYSTESNVETEEAVEEKQSGDMLMTKISTDAPMKKQMNIDIENYHTRDQSVSANGATSFSSGLSDEKESKHTNNALAPTSADDGSAAIKMKTENDGVLGRTRSVIGNDATSAEIEMGFSEIKSHPPADLPLVHSSLSRAHSKMHLGNEKVHHSISEYQHSTANTAASSETTDAKMSMESQKKNHNLKENQIVSTDDTETTTSVENERQYDLFRTVSLDDSREGDYTRTRKEFTNLKGMSHRNAARRKSIEVIDIDDRSAEVLLPEVYQLNGKEHILHDVNFYDLNHQKMRGDEIIEDDEYAEDLKENGITYDGLEEEEEEKKQEEKEENIAIDSGMSEKSNMIINEQGFHDRYSQRRKSNQHNRHNHRHSEHNYHSDHNQHTNVYNQYSQYDLHAFNQYVRNIMSSSTVSDATKFKIWKKYLYFIRQREQNNDQSNASLESSESLVKKIRKKQYNTMDGEKSLFTREGKKHVTDENNHVHLRKYKNIRGPVAHSTEINKIISTRTNGETEIKSEDVMNNQNENRETVTRTGSLISDGSIIDTASHTSKSKKTKNNNHRKQISIKTMPLKNSREDVETNTKRVYDIHDRNENVDINTKQTTETVQSTDSQSNLQHALWKTSMNGAVKQIMTREEASNEQIFSNSLMNRHQNQNDLQKASASSSSTVKSQIQTKHHSSEKSENNEEINTNVEGLIETISSSDAMTKSRSNIHNAVASSKSSDELEIRLQHDWNNFENNKDHNANAEVSADATDSMGIKNKQESNLENTLSFSESSAKSEAQVENYSNNLNTWKNTVRTGALSEAVITSVESDMKGKKKLDNFENIQINANAEKSSTAISDNERYLISAKNKQSSSKGFQTKFDYHLINGEDSQTNAISKASAETFLSNIIKNEDLSDLQKSFSSSSAISSEKLQAESDNNSNNLRNSQMGVSTAELSSKSTSSDNIENVYASGTSKSSSSKLSFQESHIKNEQYSDDINNVITNVETASSDNVRNHRRYESESSSLSSSHAKSQVENKNIRTSMSTSNNVISDKNQHHLLHMLSSYNAGKSDPYYHKYDPQTIDNDNHEHGDNILKTKSLTDSTNADDIEKSESNKSIDKSEFIKQDSEDVSSATRSVKTTDIKNIQNIMSVLSLKSSETGVSKLKQKYDMNHLKEEERIIDDSITGMSRKVGNNHQNQLLKTSSVFNSHRISEANKENHIGIVQNNRESIAATASSESTSSADNRKSQNELKETTLSASFTETQEKQNNLNVPKKSEGITSKMAIGTTSDIFNSEKVQMDDKLNDKIEVNTADSIIKNVINFRSHIKDANSINEMVSTTFNRFNRAKQNDILKVTSSDNLYAEMPRENKYSSNDLSDINSISNVNVRNKDPYEITSSVDIKSQSMIYDKPDISKNKEIINSNTHNNINEWRTNFHTTESSSSYAEWQNKRKNTMKTTVSAESTANSINEDIRDYDLMQNKFLSDHTNIAQIDKEHNCGNKKVEVKEDNSKGSISAESSGISQIKHKFDTKEKAFVASQSHQHDLNVQKEDKAITSNTLLSTEDTNFSEMRNAHQELLEASSNSRTEVQHELISDIVKKSSEVTTSAATSAQTMSSEKVEGEFEEKLIKDSAESNSYAKSQVVSNIDSNISKEGKLIGNIGTSTNSAASNHLKNIRQDKLVEKNSLFDPAHEMFDGNVPINNFANAADATVSTQETSSSIIKDEYQNSATKTAFNSYTEAQTEHEHNSNMKQQLIETTSSADVKVRAVNKNIINNMQESLKATANAISSNNIEKINKHDSSKILLSSNSYTGWNNEQKKINMHTRNFARDNKKSTITKSSATSLVLDENQKERENNFMREILQSNSQNQRITKIENHNDNTLRKNLHNSEDTATSEQATSIIKNEYQDNLLKATSLQEDESSSFKNQHLITTDSMASLNSVISAGVNKIERSDPNELTATSSSNSYVKSNVQNQNDINVLKTDHTDILSTSTSSMIDSEFKDMQRDKSLQMTSLSDSYAETQSKSENTNSIKENSNVINAKTETISSNDVKDIDVHSLFDLLANSAAKVQTESENNSQEGMYKKNNSKTSDLFSKIDSARNSRILEKNRENSAITNTMTEMESSNQHNYSHKIGYSNTQDSQYNIKSMSLANSRVTSQASKDVTKSERAKEDGEVTVNLSTLGKAEAYNKVKEAHSYDWLATSGATLAEERTQNKDKFNALGKAEEVAVHAGTSARAATSNGIESKHRDIYAKDPNDKSQDQDNWDTTKIIQDAISSTETTETTEAFKETKSEKESKNILDHKMTTLASADAEILINDREKCSVSHNLESSANTVEMYSTTSAMSSSSTSDNTNRGLGKIYKQINDKISQPTISPILKDNTKGEERLFSIETSSLPPDKTNRCNENVETKEFINEATSLYKVLNKKRNSEILLMKKNPEGLVQIASLKNSVPPLIAYRLVPREVYERIRTIIANKQIFCANCPLSNS